MARSITTRRAVRALLLTPTGSTLLLKAQDPQGEFPVWYTPGGGIERGESPQDCLRREVHEELRVELPEIGPLIWRREHTFRWNGQMLCQAEDFYLVSTEHFEPVIAPQASENERHALRACRWWTLDEIQASKDVFAPRLLGRWLRELLELGAPDEVVDFGV
ncbi:MAG: NUDIX domain-containing protein [Planctomycetales bacterium]|nr:NUDIX domain-containing protein [Planctomycetales bacterium]